jgi:DNA/RNA endonuclease YhcR with UshA esterase domain
MRIISPLLLLFFMTSCYSRKHKEDSISHEIHFVSGSDVFTIEPDTSAFAAKGLIKVNSRDINKYLSQLVITEGRVVSTQLFEPHYKVLLQVGADQPDQDFTIVIEAVNSSKFDHPEAQLKGRRVKVTGRVITYNGKPAIEISDPNQIQLLR